MTDNQPQEQSPEPPRQALRLRKAGNASGSPADIPESAPPPPVLSTPEPPRPDAQKKKPSSLRLANYYNRLAWLLFLVLGAAMAGIRYYGWLDLQDEFQMYGPWVALALHLVVVVLAAKEDIFTGFLCLVIPGYSLYFLVSRSGRPFLCALTFGLLAGIGEDTFVALRELSTQYYDQITRWISGNNRR